MKKLIALSLVFSILVGFISLFPQKVYAEAAGPTPTPKASEPAAPAANESTYTFQALGTNDTILYGPYDSMSVRFALPANWKVKTGTTISLIIDPAYTVAPQSGVLYGGRLYITYNEKYYYEVLLDWTGERVVNINIPDWAANSDRADGRFQLDFFLDAAIDCRYEHETTVKVSGNSQFIIPHEAVEPKIGLNLLPLPFYQRYSVETTPTFLIVPENPTAAEMQAAMTVSAAFGRLTTGNLPITLTTMSKISKTDLGSVNLVFVGKASSLPDLQKISLPVTSDGQSFAALSANPDDGVIQEGLSPWNTGGAVLVVSGNSEAGVLKAAQALSSGTLRAGSNPSVAFVAGVIDNIVTPNIATDRSLTDLGTGNVMIGSSGGVQMAIGIGLQTVDVNFFIPPGQVSSEDAYFDLAFNSSGLLDEARSGLSMYVNGQTFGSTRLGESTKQVTRERFPIPVDALHAGNNQLTIEVNLMPLDDCSLYSLNNLWVSVMGSSTLHLPLTPAVMTAATARNLGFYPEPFTADPTYQTTSIILPKDDLNAWNVAAQSAEYLGREATGTLVQFGLAFADAVPEETKQNQNLLIFGKPTSLPIIAELGDALPGPFPGGSNIANERSFQVTYRVPEDTSIGYVELLASPWNIDQTIIAVLGSNDEGLKMAGSAVTLQPMRAQLGGDFAVTNGTQVLFSESRQLAGTGNLAAEVVQAQSTAVPGVDAAQPPVVTLDAPIAFQQPQTPITATGRPIWVAYAIAAISVLVVLTLIIVGILAVVNNHRKASRR